ncbi:MAG: hypothetical protein M3R21_11040 [Candidatus Dormibacteraeota bacterium]|nr:hypothetical protein [Candidatus Dormibacteraeota bacterium]
MADVRKALEAEREMEREFVAEARKSETQPKGWPAALLLFHLCMWRERLLNALTDVRDGRPHVPPPENADEVNDAELASGLGVSLADIHERSDTLLDSLIQLSDQVGDRSFKWYAANTTAEALLRNSYTHPRLHIAEYWKENGQRERAHRVFEEAEADMRDISAPPIALATVLYNLACARVDQGRLDDALSLLGEALPMRPELRVEAASDPDLAALRDEARFKALVQS